MSDKQYDVVAVKIADSSVLWVDGPFDAGNAEAVIKMAIMRQGVEDRFFGTAATGHYKSGDKWTTGVPLPPETPDYFTAGGMRYPRGKRGL